MPYLDLGLRRYMHHVPQVILAGGKPRALGAYSERFRKLPKKIAEDPDIHALIVFNSENI